MASASIRPSAASEPGEDIVLSARDVAKSFGSVHALKTVNFDVYRGQVATLFGENGAGKSTLMKILSGVIQPTSGEILLEGEPVRFASTTDAQRLGISIIHQELSLAPNLSVRDNIFMGRELKGPMGIDYAEEARQTRALMEELDEPIDPLTPVEDLRLGQQQIVEIARALSVNSRILIMDEPTSALSATEVEVLFRVIRDLKSRGVSIVYISHHLEEALLIIDHAVVLRDGVMTAYARRADIDLEWIVRNMVGENFDLGSPPTGHAMGEVALSLENVSVATLGLLYVARGVALLMTDGLTYNNLGGSPELGNTGFDWLGFNRLFGVPVGVLILAAVAVVTILALARTPFGRWVYSTGATRGRPSSPACRSSECRSRSTCSPASAWRSPGWCSLPS
jgi:erythritol transport system ATP-binding protein